MLCYTNYSNREEFNEANDIITAVKEGNVKGYLYVGDSKILK